MSPMSLEDAWTQAIRASAKRLWSVDLAGALLDFARAEPTGLRIDFHSTGLSVL